LERYNICPAALDMVPFIVKAGPSMPLSHDWKNNKVVVAMVIITDLNLKKFIRLQNLGAKIVKM
jgi:hypothetical protein